jgi:glucose-6-phosphate 1-dehydrogenase
MQTPRVLTSPSIVPTPLSPPADPCVLVIFGASGDLTKRLLMPALYNLRCDGLLSDRLGIVGIALDDMTTEAFRDRLSHDIRTFQTRKDFDEKVWNGLVSQIHYMSGKFDDPAAFARLRDLVARLDQEIQAGGNVLFYLATPPTVFGLVGNNLAQAGFLKFPGWQRLIVEKPFGTSLNSARELNRQLLTHWNESQIYRIDHYLGKETVQNMLAFRFANGMFEPVWNKYHVDHIQFTVNEAVSVEGRGAYYDRSGVLRDMIQNHMLQMLAYVCMEPPISFAPDDIRNEKAKVLQAVRVFQTDEDVRSNTVRGQYGPGKKADGTDCPAYRAEKSVNPQSNTETFAAIKLLIDNWRWEGVPVYLRSGKALWKRGTEIVVEFKKAPQTQFRGTKVDRLSANRLIFHIQPEQAIQVRFQAKVPGPVMRLQPVNMLFTYGEAFRAPRATGYEVMLYSCMTGDPTLFSRTDLVESAWRIAQPILDTWTSHPAKEFPNYPAGSWGPLAAYDLIQGDGRRWYEVVTTESLQRVPLFKGGEPLLLNQVVMALSPRVASAKEVIIKQGEIGTEMFLISRGDVEVVDVDGKVLNTLRPGDCFGEVALLFAEPRNATVRAKDTCDLFVLDKADFARILRDHPQLAEAVLKIARDRYRRDVAAEQLTAPA